jgi:hypothetical protein
MGDSTDWDAADDLPADSGPRPDEGDVVDGDWGQATDVDDDAFVSAFTDEIANVTASDWDLDADVLWGDDVPPGLGADPGAMGYDLPM